MRDQSKPEQQFQPCCGCNRLLALSAIPAMGYFTPGELPICWKCAETRWSLTDLQQATERQRHLPSDEDVRFTI